MSRRLGAQALGSGCARRQAGYLRSQGQFQTWKESRVRGISATTLVLIWVLPGWQTAGLASQDLALVKVTVLDRNDARVTIGVVVVIENEAAREKLYVNEKGEAEAQMPAGIYQVRVDASGFKAYEDRSFSVDPNRRNELTVRLDAAPVGVGDSIGEWRPIEIQNAPLVDKIKPIRW